MPTAITMSNFLPKTPTFFTKKFNKNLEVCFFFFGLARKTQGANGFVKTTNF